MNTEIYSDIIEFESIKDTYLILEQIFKTQSYSPTEITNNPETVRALKRMKIHNSIISILHALEKIDKEAPDSPLCQSILNCLKIWGIENLTEFRNCLAHGHYTITSDCNTIHLRKDSTINSTISEDNLEKLAHDIFDIVYAHAIPEKFNFLELNYFITNLILNSQEHLSIISTTPKVYASLQLSYSLYHALLWQKFRHQTSRKDYKKATTTRQIFNNNLSTILSLDFQSFQNFHFEYLTQESQANLMFLFITSEYEQVILDLFRINGENNNETLKRIYASFIYPYEDFQEDVINLFRENDTESDDIIQERIQKYAIYGSGQNLSQENLANIIRNFAKSDKYQRVVLNLFRINDENDTETLRRIYASFVYPYEGFQEDMINLFRENNTESDDIIQERIQKYAAYKIEQDSYIVINLMMYLMINCLPEMARFTDSIDTGWQIISPLKSDLFYEFKRKKGGITTQIYPAFETLVTTCSEREFLNSSIETILNFINSIFTPPVLLHFLLSHDADALSFDNENLKNFLEDLKEAINSKRNFHKTYNSGMTSLNEDEKDTLYRTLYDFSIPRDTLISKIETLRSTTKINFPILCEYLAYLLVTDIHQLMSSNDNIEAIRKEIKKYNTIFMTYIEMLPQNENKNKITFTMLHKNITHLLELLEKKSSNLTNSGNTYTDYSKLLERLRNASIHARIDVDYSGFSTGNKNETIIIRPTTTKDSLSQTDNTSYLSFDNIRYTFQDFADGHTTFILADIYGYDLGKILALQDEYIISLLRGRLLEIPTSFKQTLGAKKYLQEYYKELIKKIQKERET